jgi:signal transduction histidine kinase
VLNVISFADFELSDRWDFDSVGKTDFTQTQQYQWQYTRIGWAVNELTTALHSKTPQGFAERVDELFQHYHWQVIEMMAQEYAQTITSAQIMARYMRDYNFNGFGDEFDEDNHFPHWESFIREELALEYKNMITHTDAREFFDEEYTEAIEALRISTDQSIEQAAAGLRAHDTIAYYFVQVGDTIYQNSDYNFLQIFEKYQDTMWNNDLIRGGVGERYAFTLTPEYIELKNRELASLNQRMENALFYAIAWLIWSLVCVIYLVAGAKKLISIDKIPTEFTILFILAFVYCGFWVCTYYYHYGDNMFSYVFIMALVILFALIYTMFGSIVRHTKKRTLHKNSLLYRFHAEIFKGIKTLYSKENPMFKTVIAVTALGILTMFPYAGLITIPFALFLVYLQVVSFKKLKNGIQAVRSGDYNHVIELSEKDDSEFAKLSADINEISTGLSEEVERRIKSERLKTELIVNVSHDIRTPLTSLITYADLLKKENTKNESIKKYAEIISQKSDRLKTLTDDLFESAKAASGNVNVELANVEVNALLIQALAEFDEKIKESSLEFKMNLPQEKVIAYADGKLLWRVIENLMSNAIRYSLENSRVYVNVREGVDSILIEMKNVSKTELNFSEDEVTERFKRGDLSRNTEGSGLGLDIASSLMQCQNGNLSVKIDGDLFKVCLAIPKANLV